MITPQDLRAVDLFDEVDDDALAGLIDAGVERRVGIGTDLVSPGDPPSFLVILEGEFETLYPVGGGEETDIRRHVAPTFLGATVVLGERIWQITVRAATPSVALDVPAPAYRTFARAHESVERASLALIFPTASRIATLTQQREKLAALGTMAAGLAHELNNPAAAARRSADEMARALTTLDETLGAFVESGVERAEAEKLLHLKRDAVAASLTAEPLDAMRASDLEDAMSDRLEGLVDEPWEVAEPLVAAGLGPAWVDQVQSHAGPATGAAVRWVAATMTAQGLAGELRESTNRISTLVTAIKDYTYMDQSAQQEVDLHDGLESTLTILGYKLRAGTITVVREYDRTLPRTMVHGSELNQVWTNLLDNAIDAMEAGGTLTLRTSRDGGTAVIEIIDTGLGIPEEIRSRVFDPFFTTKEPGRGTGLGLQAAHRIVTESHRGELALDPGPDGRGTRAVVRLPLTG